MIQMTNQAKNIQVLLNNEWRKAKKPKKAPKMTAVTVKISLDK